MFITPTIREKLAKLDRLEIAIEEYLMWLSMFPQAQRILTNLRAEGNGEMINAGSPGLDDNCTISGLRTQLLRMEAVELQKLAQVERAAVDPLQVQQALRPTDGAAANDGEDDMSLETSEDCARPIGGA